MSKSQPNPFDYFDPDAPRKQVLCKILQMESAVGAKELIVTCSIREGEFNEFADLMFLDADTQSLKEFFEAREIWIRVNNEVCPGEPVGNLIQTTVELPASARRAPKRR